MSYRTHGHSANGGTPTYQSWAAMCARVTSPSCKRKRWAKNGVTVCERWRSFENFLADMGERPTGTTLDRISSAGNYEPSNCRWATIEEQNRNRSSVVLTFEAAKTIAARLLQGDSQGAIARETGHSVSNIHSIVTGKSWRDALSAAKAEAAAAGRATEIPRGRADRRRGAWRLQAVREALATGETTRSIAERLAVSVRTVRRVRNGYRTAAEDAANTTGRTR